MNASGKSERAWRHRQYQAAAPSPTSAIRASSIPPLTLPSPTITGIPTNGEHADEADQKEVVSAVDQPLHGGQLRHFPSARRFPRLGHRCAREDFGGLGIPLGIMYAQHSHPQRRKTCREERKREDVDRLVLDAVSHEVHRLRYRDDRCRRHGDDPRSVEADPE